MQVIIDQYNESSIEVQVLHEEKVYTISGSVNSYGEFHPFHFHDEESENFYDSNWEFIETKIQLAY